MEHTGKILVGGFTQEALNELARAIRMAKHRPPKGRRYGERDNVLLTERKQVVAEMRRLHVATGLSWSKIARRLRGNPRYAPKMRGVSDKSWIAYAYRK